MRYAIMAAVLAASSGGALAQQSQWGGFEAGGGFGVGVQAADGAQLMLKCDKPGDGSVYAVIATTKSLVPPAQTFVMRSADIEFSGRPVYDDRLRAYEHTVIAINKGNERSLSRFLAGLTSSSSVEMRVYADPKAPKVPTTFKFNVAGAKEAVDQVYASCKDKLPTA